MSSSNIKFDRITNTGLNSNSNPDVVKRHTNDYKYDDFPFCDNVEKYEKILRIGKGTFGEVFRAKHRITKKDVALKKILMDNEQEGFPITALREIKLLKYLRKSNADNVVNLFEVCRSAEQANGKAISYLVFEFCHHDLAGLIQEGYEKISNIANLKCIVKQLLTGLYSLHRLKVIHRDMKSSNILITKNGELKIADFGLARPYHNEGETKKYTNRVVTLWYRPPELLLGERSYSCAIDLWGVGCIMAELFIRGPLMKGSSEQNQLQLIADTVGPINETVWPNVVNLPYYSKLSKTLNNPKTKGRLSRICHDNHAQDLLKKLLCLDPQKRINSSDALDHDFIWEAPEPASKEKLAQSLAQLGSFSFEFTSRNKKYPGHNHHMGPNIVNGRALNSHTRPVGHRPGPSSNNDGQYRDHVY